MRRAFIDGGDGGGWEEGRLGNAEGEFGSLWPDGAVWLWTLPYWDKLSRAARGAAGKLIVALRPFRHQLLVSLLSSAPHVQSS